MHNTPIPFVGEVEIFNKKFNKTVNEVPTIPDAKEIDFVCDFIIEEAEELREAAKSGDIVKVLDAISDITYVCLGNATLTFGLKYKILQAYAEVQASNLSKSCATLEEAEETVKVRSNEFSEPCHYEAIEGGGYAVYRSRDRKALKSIKWKEPDLKQFFTEEELNTIANDPRFTRNSEAAIPNS